MAKNVGTLISSAIRPNDSLDPIASAFATEIRGGLHTAIDITTRNAIIFERREWGMMCYVQSDNKTYQLTYNFVSTSIMDNSNWKEFSGSGGSGGGGGTEWIDSVISVAFSQPGSPSIGDRYLLGIDSSIVLSGAQWSSFTSSQVAEWNSSTWTLTVPKDGMSVRVDDEDNSIYKYEGNFPTGAWQKEKLGQVRNLAASTSNGVDYIATTTPPISNYNQDSFVNEDLFNVKYYIEPTDYIVVPPYYQYWVYSDLTIAGTLVNYGQIIVVNGSLYLSGGTISNSGSLAFITLNTGLTTSFNDSETIDFTQENTIMGLSVSAIVKDGSLTASKLDTGTNGGATAGYILSVDNAGKFNWLDPSQTSGTLTSSDKNFQMAFTTNGDGQFTGLTISQTPLPGGYVGVFVNGQEFEVGYGTTTSVPCYFSDDGGVTSKINVQSGDALYWNGNFVGTDLYSTWRISLYYIN